MSTPIRGGRYRLGRASITGITTLCALGACREPAPRHHARHAPGWIPAHFPSPPDEPLRNTRTPAGIELGERLFHDPILSRSKTVACSTCHEPSLAFTDGVARSTAGASGHPLTRNAPALTNLAWGTAFLWDGGARDLESQAIGPLTHPDERGADLAELTHRLGRDPSYRAAFGEAFEAETIESAHVVRAIAQFERSIVSASSRYDRFVDGLAELSPLETRGRLLFESSQCAVCHLPPLFTDWAFHNNGLDESFSDREDGVLLGRYRITHDRDDIGKFKTPTLRNVARTAPYMHDGRIETLKGVLDHYDSELVDSPTLSPILQAAGTIGIPLRDDEKAAIIAFLRTLTDDDLLDDSAADTEAVREHPRGFTPQ
ncbi:MAG: cytochrome c peroxidase [Myxococcota bacterium]